MHSKRLIILCTLTALVGLGVPVGALTSAPGFDATPDPHPRLASAVESLRDAGAPADAVKKLERASQLLSSRTPAAAAGAPLLPEPALLGPTGDLVTKVFGDGCDAPPAHPAMAAVRVPRPPIAIRKDLDLTPLNGVVGGTGTVDDPFVIAGWDIRGALPAAGGAPRVGLLIQGTTAHVRIEHVSVRPGLALPEAFRILGAPELADGTATSLGSLPTALTKVSNRHIGIHVVDAKNVVISDADATGAEIGIAVSGDVGVEIRCSRLTGNAWSGLGDDFLPVQGHVSVVRSLISKNGWGGVDFWENAGGKFEFKANLIEANAWAGVNFWGDMQEPAEIVIADNVARGNEWGGFDVWGDFEAAGSIEMLRNSFTGNEWAGINVWGDFESDGVLSVRENTANGNAWGGIEIWGDFEAPAVVYVEDNVANANAWSGIDLWGDLRGGGSTIVAGNEAHDNGWGGIELWGDLVGAYTVVAGNEATGNAWGGIEVWGRTIGGSLEILANVADGNAYAGIGAWRGARSGGEVILRDNDVTGNGGGDSRFAGIEASTEPTGTVLVTGNRIEGNENAGVGSDHGSVRIEGNEILGNRIGVLARKHHHSPPAIPVITGNNLVGNAEWGVFNTHASVVSAESNWWGDASGPGGEGPGTGDKASANVDYTPWRTSPI